MRAKLFLLSLFTICVSAQNSVVDSLSLKVNSSQSEITKAKLLNEIADNYKNRSPKLMIEYANKALALSKQIGYKLEQGNAYHNIGNANIIMGDYASALDNFSKEQIIFENELPRTTVQTKKDINDGLARAYGSIGFVFMEQSNYSKALQYNFKALKIFELTNNAESLSKIYNNIGVIYKSQNAFSKALVYYEKCLKIQEKLKNVSIGVTTNNIGLVYLNQRAYEKAIKYFDQSKVYFDKYPNPYGLAQLYYNYGDYYTETGENVKAMQNTQKALALFQNIENKFGIADSYYHLGAIYFKQKNYTLALESTNKGLLLARQLNVLDKVQAFEKQISAIYEKQNNTAQALKHYKLYSAAKDSVANAETVKSTVRAEMNFDFERKELLQKEEQAKREIIYKQDIRSNRLKIFFGALFALFIVGVVFLINNRAQLKKTLTLEKELAVYEQKALHLQMNPHFIFNCLGSISNFILKNSTEAAIKYLAKFSKLMRLTLEYSKEALIPIDKEIESLANYLELEQLRFNNAFQFGINKSDEIEDDVALPPLLLQPFVENAIIHGMDPKVDTGRIAVDFYIENGNLVCVITDNGIGINKSKELKKKLVSMHKSMALDITRKRLEMLETSTTQKSAVVIEEIEENGKTLGTRAKLILPLQYMST
ncbi:MAG: tetratricopeptide repeat protein [Chitinophagaceae bacterium]|nr:MAG: tetratricopeptide repeat protein [Chitinophagaceae bacterium]